MEVYTVSMVKYFNLINGGIGNFDYESHDWWQQ